MGIEGVSIRTLLATLVAIYVLSLLVGYALHGPGPLFDAATLLLGTGFGLLLLVLLVIVEPVVFPLVASLVFTCLVFVLPRIVQYLWMPALVDWPFGNGVTNVAVNHGLMMLLSGTASIVLGFVGVAAIARRAWGGIHWPAAEARLPFSIPAVMLIFGLFLAVEAYITVVMGIGVFGKLRADTGNTAIQLLKGLVGLDMVFFMGLIAVVVGRDARKYLWAAVLVVIYLAYLSYTGTRVGALRVLTMLFMYMLAAQGNFRVRLVDHALVLLALVVVNLLSFPVGTYTRNQTIAARFEQLAGVNQRSALPTPASPTPASPTPASPVPSSPARPVPSADQTLRAAKAIKSGEDLELYSRPLRFMAVIMNRLGALDYLVLVMTEPGDPEDKARYLSLGYAAKSALNTFVPGAPFPEAELSTSRTHSIIYRGIKGISHLSGYFSEYWTMWGLAFLLFGWVGGLVVLIVAGALFQATFLAILRHAGGYRVYLGAWFLLMSYLYYLSMGVDHSVTVSAITLLQVITALAGFQVAETGLRVARGPVPAPL